MHANVFTMGLISLSPDCTWPNCSICTGFFQALADGQPDRVMAMLTDPRSVSYVGSLPQTVFIEALHRLSPAHFVEPIHDLHQHLHSWSSFLNGVKRVEEVFDDFVNNLFTVVRHRTSGGYRLELAEYTHLLDCARAMGNGPLATINLS